MDEAELSIYQSMPDYVDLSKEPAAAYTQPSEQEPMDENTNSETDEVNESQNSDSSESEEQVTEPTDGQPEDEEVTTEEPAEEKYTVKVNGKEIEVTLDDLKKSYMMESDYRRKTTELAEERRAIESQSEARTKELERLRSVVTEAEQTLARDLQNSEVRALREAINKIDVASLTSEQLAQFMQAKAHCEQLENREREKIAKFEATSKKYMAEQEKLLQEQYAQDQKILRDEIPELNDPAKREKLNQDISNYLLAVYGDKKAREIAPTIRSKEDYKTLYYATLGKRFLETKTPVKTMPKGKNISAKNQTGAQTVTSTSKSQKNAILSKIKANGTRGEASDADIIQYLLS